MYDNHQKTQKESTEFDSAPYKGAHEVLSSELQQPQHLTADALFWGVTYTKQTRPRQHAFQLQNEPPDEGQDVSDVQKDEELQCIEAENLSTLNLTSETQKQGQDHTSSKTYDIHSEEECFNVSLQIELLSTLPIITMHRRERQSMQPLDLYVANSPKK